MAPKIFKKIGRGFRKLYCIKIAKDDLKDPAYGVEDGDDIETPEESPKIPSPKQELTPKESLDFLETPQVTPEIPSPIEELKRRDYQLITLYKADDPSYEHCTIGDDEDDENSSCSSSEYFTCEEDNVSSTSSSDSEVRNCI
ncbi:hypothetical protein AVEN_39766-1 [Araneus ventricosus]|uniref:Uncharacterized protein n=1 Tax=Araneus ventricosus TaxID=182803 RepID=A0A4Y2GHP7_ARAVE|nr:hypothetical protein AVEN_39766-1 [Araneus ventricosus]